MNCKIHGIYHPRFNQGNLISISCQTNLRKRGVRFVWKKDSFQSSLKYWGSSFSVNRQLSNRAFGAILGTEKSLFSGLKLLLYHHQAHGHKGLEKEIRFSSYLPKYYHSIISLKQGYLS